MWVRLWVLLASPFKPVSDWPPLLRFWGPDKKNATFPKEKRHFDHLKVVGATGFEPATSWSRTKRSTRLSHAPVWPPSGGKTGGTIDGSRFGARENWGGGRKMPPLPISGLQTDAGRRNALGHRPAFPWPGA